MKWSLIKNPALTLLNELINSAGGSESSRHTGKPFVCLQQRLSIPSKEVIDTFFGVSGKHWTPQAWARLTQQVDEMELDKEPSSDPVRLNELINTAGVRAITGERNQKLQSKNVPQEAA